jgi:hypothetical protein
VPHGSVLFRIRFILFSPKRDQPELFNPGEKPFISHLEKWEPFREEKLPFHYLPTVVDKQRQAAVILTVSSGRQPGGYLFMKPGPVSVRFFQTCFPQTFSNQVDQVASPEGFAV